MHRNKSCRCQCCSGKLMNKADQILNQTHAFKQFLDLLDETELNISKSKGVLQMREYFQQFSKCEGPERNQITKIPFIKNQSMLNKLQEGKYYEDSKRFYFPRPQTNYINELMSQKDFSPVKEKKKKKKTKEIRKFHFQKMSHLLQKLDSPPENEKKKNKLIIKKTTQPCLKNKHFKDTYNELNNFTYRPQTNNYLKKSATVKFQKKTLVLESDLQKRKQVLEQKISDQNKQMKTLDKYLFNTSESSNLKTLSPKSENILNSEYFYSFNEIQNPATLDNLTIDLQNPKIYQKYIKRVLEKNLKNVDSFRQHYFENINKVYKNNGNKLDFLQQYKHAKFYSQNHQQIQGFLPQVKKSLSPIISLKKISSEKNTSRVQQSLVDLQQGMSYKKQNKLRGSAEGEVRLFKMYK